jgi:predicted GNAT family acetyltransferase
VQAAKKDKLKINPVCGYAAAWLRKHKEYHDLLA